MRNECMGLINLEDRKNSNINQITYSRPIASTPVGGRYRIIDFTLSNMVNAGFTNVGIFSKEKYRSLTDHVGSGKDWDLPGEFLKVLDFVNCILIVQLNMAL